MIFGWFSAVLSTYVGFLMWLIRDSFLYSLFAMSAISFTSLARKVSVSIRGSPRLCRTSAKARGVRFPLM